MSDLTKAVEEAELKLNELSKRVDALAGDGEKLSLTEMSKAELLQMLEAIHQATLEDKKTIDQLTTANRKLKYRCNFLVRELNNAEEKNKQA